MKRTSFSWAASRAAGPARTYADAVAAATLARAYTMADAHQYVLSYVSALTASR